MLPILPHILVFFALTPTHHTIYNIHVCHPKSSSGLQLTWNGEEMMCMFFPLLLPLFSLGLPNWCVYVPPVCSVRVWYTVMCPWDCKRTIFACCHTWAQEVSKQPSLATHRLPFLFYVFPLPTIPCSFIVFPLFPPLCQPNYLLFWLCCRDKPVEDYEPVCVHLCLEYRVCCVLFSFSLSACYILPSSSYYCWMIYSTYNEIIYDMYDGYVAMWVFPSRSMWLLACVFYLSVWVYMRPRALALPHLPSPCSRSLLETRMTIEMAEYKPYKKGHHH